MEGVTIISYNNILWALTYKNAFVISRYECNYDFFIPLSHINGKATRTRNGLYPLLFVNVRYMFFKCSVYVLLSSAKERYWRPTFDKFAGKI